MTPEHRESNVLVFFFMILVLCLAMPFTVGLLTLWVVQMRNFCTGMTTMERLGGHGRQRSFSYVEEIRVHTAEDDDYTT